MAPGERSLAELDRGPRRSDAGSDQRRLQQAENHEDAFGGVGVAEVLDPVGHAIELSVDHRIDVFGTDDNLAVVVPGLFSVTFDFPNSGFALNRLPSKGIGRDMTIAGRSSPPPICLPVAGSKELGDA